MEEMSDKINETLDCLAQRTEEIKTSFDYQQERLGRHRRDLERHNTVLKLGTERMDAHALALGQLNAWQDKASGSLCRCSGAVSGSGSAEDPFELALEYATPPRVVSPPAEVMTYAQSVPSDAEDRPAVQVPNQTLVTRLWPVDEEEGGPSTLPGPTSVGQRSSRRRDRREESDRLRNGLGDSASVVRQRHRLRSLPSHRRLRNNLRRAREEIGLSPDVFDGNDSDAISTWTESSDERDPRDRDVGSQEGPRPRLTGDRRRDRRLVRGSAGQR